MQISSHWFRVLAAALAALLIVESVFAIFIYLPHKARLKRLAEYPPPLTREEREALFERCLKNIPDLERYLLLWFLGADASEIKRDNIRDFILWAFFDRDGGTPTPYADEPLSDQEDELDGYIRRIESVLGRTLSPGRGSATPLRLTIDPISIRYHSIIWYAIIGFLDLTTHAILRFHGFAYHSLPSTTTKSLTTTFPPTPALRTLPFPFTKRHISPSLPYWHRPHRSTTHRPILFLHGIGIGLWPYTSFFAALASSGIGIIALELLPISARLTSPPLPRETFLADLTAILAAHPEFRHGFTLVSHSYGSVLTTHILHSPELAPMVASLVLIDPVSILLHLPNVAYNFTRRRPKRANEWQLWYFASMDAGVAGALGRHFFWRENIVWREELTTAGTGERGKRKLAVCLAGRDLIVDTGSVARYLLGEGDFRDQGGEGPDGRVNWEAEGPEGIEVVWFAEMDHAQVFEGRRERERVVDVVRRYCAVEGLREGLEVVGGDG